MKYDFISIEHQTIRGIKNPGLTLVGNITKDDFSFKVLVDGKENEYEINFNKLTKRFIIKSVFSKDAKDILVYVICDDKEYLIYSGSNTIFKRVKGKIKDIIYPKYTKLRAIRITLIKGIKYLWKEYHLLVPISLWKKYWHDFKNRVEQRGEKFYNEPNDVSDYQRWIEKYEEKPIYEELSYNPLISVLIPVYNINRKYLSECLDSILNGKYQNFEICLVDDASTLKETKETLEEYANKDKRVRVLYRKKNGHISAATNDALHMANGEFISLVDDDDILTPDALYQVVKVLNDNQKLDFIYSDEDKLDTKGRRAYPNFKPDWSPNTLMSLNYICHLTTIRKNLVEEVGGFEVGLEGAQDYDLFLKVTEKTNNIYHIPRILYHWRMVEGSTSMTINNKNYAVNKGALALENALKRRGLKGKVLVDDVSTYYKIEYSLEYEPKVSIIIPTKDYADTLETCLKSLYKKTSYKNFEVIVMDNNSVESETFKLFKKYEREHTNFKVIKADYEFNYSRINNEAVKHATGQYVCLLNNDTEIITDKWLTIMMGYAHLKHVGCVGPKLLYPDQTVQHGGVILGLGGVASHAYIAASRYDLGDYGRLRVPYNYAAVTAACLLISKDKYLKVNGLEEDLRVAYNDIDFNIKLLEKGYYNVFLPQVELFHFESKSRGYDNTPEKYERFKIESEYMYNKWNKILNDDPYYNDNYSKKAWFKLEK